MDSDSISLGNLAMIYLQLMSPGDVGGSGENEIGTAVSSPGHLGRLRLLIYMQIGKI